MTTQLTVNDRKNAEMYRRTSPLIASHRKNAEVYHGNAICKEKFRGFLEKISMPNGLFPLDDAVEVGYNASTDFLWLIQKKEKDHTFRSIDSKVLYDDEITAFVEERRMSRVTGVRNKSGPLEISVSDIYIDDPASGKIKFVVTTQFGQTFSIQEFIDDESKK
ncbi:hypothetical protein U1Q18_010372 [Sarracenia purpurea var. burkii]